MHPKRASAWLLRATAIGIILVALAPLLLSPDLLMKDPRLTAWTGLLLAIGAAAALVALAALIAREATAPPEVHSALSRLQQQLMEVQVKLRELQLMSDRASRAGPSHAEAPQKDYTAQFDQLATAIAEVREISLLPDADRRQRLQLYRAQRKATLIRELFGLVAAHEWPRAERMLITLETEYPNDDEVAKGRSYLDHSRRLFADDAIQKATAQIEELMASAAWDRALEQAQLLVQGFPDNGDAHALLTRVQRERDTYRETTCQRMFEEIRHDIDRRIWRRALMHAERLLEQFPQHRLAEGIRAQLATLQENAEIQERQEMEVRIQELIRDGRFDEAIELAEDVLRRFPLSSQAEALDKLLPRIRELARQGVQPSGTTE